MQSIAINLYLAKKANLQGESDSDYAKSSFVLAESMVRTALCVVEHGVNA
jgi:hypothetical protein